MTKLYKEDEIKVIPFEDDFLIVDKDLNLLVDGASDEIYKESLDCYATESLSDFFNSIFRTDFEKEIGLKWAEENVEDFDIELY